MLASKVLQSPSYALCSFCSTAIIDADAWSALSLPQPTTPTACSLGCTALKNAPNDPLCLTPQTCTGPLSSDAPLCLLKSAVISAIPNLDDFPLYEVFTLALNLLGGDNVEGMVCGEDGDFLGSF